MLNLYIFIHFFVVSLACHPECRYQCDDPVCPAKCQAICSQPNCNILYKVGDGNFTVLDGFSPNCNCQCTNDGCEADQCPQCEALCEEFTSCPEGAICEIQCLPIQANWYCEKPTNCPKPICELSCESPACAYEGVPQTTIATSAQSSPSRSLPPDYYYYDISFNSSTQIRSTSIQEIPVWFIILLFCFIFAYIQGAS